MDRIEYLADVIVRRGCGFALLAICMVMLGLSYDLLLCLKSGAILQALHGSVLGLFAYNAPKWNHRSTELWVLLDKGADLPPNYPPEQLLEVLRKTYIRYAEMAGVVTLALCIGAAIVWVVRG
ncbi:MAG: hypothetical protein EPO10_00570 [Reyranella sp.]|uniref:hypothetical protein n=1 Tax=Reyranella sp. TaxID=1929291 RepID=UPI001224F792|nr:hypothetical protein [Reyranella sp.]TAJ97978.1 MAG: hypothetical protein EPO41_00500 [Reyranella sp.]TBR30885.1 MAG: hypothetical protein EPO10_00570 [Reyranella sp.]